jgi:photosystem II stability/assembly factor-like uncharacterized protein
MKKNLLASTVILFCLFISNISISQTIGNWTKTGGPEGGTTNSIAMTSAGMYAATNEGMYISNNNGASWTLMGLPTNPYTRLVSYTDTLIAIYHDLSYTNTYSITSFDGGLTWTPASLIETGTSGSASQLYFLRTGNTIFLNGDAYYFSNDFGTTWSTLNSPNGRIYSLSCGRDKIIISDLNSTTLNFERYISDASPINWQFIDSTYMSSNFVYSDTVIVGQVFESLTTYCVRSVDNGLTWDTTFQIPGSYNMLSQNGVSLDTLYINSNALDFYQSIDRGLTWTNCPIPHIWNYQESLFPPNGTEIALYQQNVVQYFAATDTFQTSHSGIKANRISMLKGFGNNLYAGHSTGLSVSTDAGISWQPLLQSYKFSYNIISAITKIGDTLLVASSDSFYVSTDAGSTWTNGVYVTNNFIDPMSVEFMNNKIYLGTSNGIFVSNNLGLTWTEDSIPSSGFCTTFANENLWIAKSASTLFAITNSGVVAHLDQTSQLWVNDTCFFSSGAHTGNIITTFDSTVLVRSRTALYRSDNYGQDFYDLGTTIYPYKIIYVNGSLFGFTGTNSLWISNDRGSTWSLVDGTTLPFDNFYDLASINDQIFCSSLGSSVWKRNGTLRTYFGHVYRDNNFNGIIDGQDSTLSNIVLNTNPSLWISTTDSSGLFQLTTDAQGDSLKVNVPSFINVIPSAYLLDTVNFTNLDFLLQIDTTVSDLSVDLECTTRISFFRDNIFLANTKNKGGLIQSGILKVVIDTLFNYITADRAPLQINGDTIFWRIDTLDFNESTLINITTHVKPNASIGDSVKFSAEIIPDFSDAFPGNNISYVSDIIVAAFDPNDKACNIGDQISIDSVAGKDFVYTIRFQNIGNFPATDVTIIDTLNFHLDATSLQVLNSSFPVSLEMQSTGLVKFHFYGINLIDSTTNEPLSHGFVKYSVKAKNSTSVGDAITNTANIYFDFNPPITTNTVTTLVIDPALTASVSFDQSLRLTVYPNPTNDVLNISTSVATDNLRIILCDQTGRVVKNIESSVQIDVSDLNPGYYFGLVFNKSVKVGSFRSIIVR